MKINYALQWKSAKRMLWDLMAPALVACTISLYGYFTDTTEFNIFKFLGSFFTTLFFVASYAAWFQRSRKLVIDEQNHLNVVGKQDAVINRLENLASELSERQDVLVTRLEGLADDLVGHTTGGTSFSYVSMIFFGPSRPGPGIQ